VVSRLRAAHHLGRHALHRGWIRVDGCRCGGFFVAADVLEWRLPRLTTGERAELSATIQGLRAMGRAAWLSTADGAISGRLVIRSTGLQMRRNPEEGSR
jgi:hypothetical protein